LCYLGAMHILYAGQDIGTSTMRIAALRRLGHEVTLVDPFDALPKHRLVHAGLWRLGGPGYDLMVRRFLDRALGDRRFDLAWVDSGEFIGPASARRLRQAAPKVLLYNVDNPFGPRDGKRWTHLKRALPLYDLFYTPRSETAALAPRYGSPLVVRDFQACDDIVHRPVILTEADHARFDSEVSFVGTWMPGRDDFILTLLDKGVPLRLFGSHWARAPLYDRLKHVTYPDGLKGGDYTRAIQCARICVGLISRGNADLHTQRSVEVPTIGSVLCAERTDDHLALYEEDREALFFDTAEDCADKCLALLADPQRLAAVATAGQARALRNNHFFEVRLSGLIARVFAPTPMPDSESVR